MSLAAEWVSNSPSHWTRGRIKNLIGSASNGTWGNDPAGDATDVRCIRAADFDRTARLALLDRAPLRSVDAASLRKHMLRAGDLILEKSGGGEKQPVGMAVLFVGTEAAVCSNFCARVTPAEGTDPRFLVYVLAAAYGQGLTQSAIKQTTGIQNLDSGAFFSSAWAYPELDEQCRIADFLDAEIARIDRLVDLRRSMLDRLEERDKAVRDSFVNRLANQAGEIPLRRFTAIIEQGESPQCEAVSRDDSAEWAVLKLSSVKRGVFEPEENKRLPVDAVPTRAYEVRPGDLLVTRANTPKLVGDVAIATGKCERLLLPDLIYRVKLGSGILPSFVAQVALSGRVRAAIESSARGTSQSMVKLRGEDIKAWLMPQATVAQQRELVHVVAQATAASSRLRTLIVRQLALLTKRRQALITAAVTGQLDVTTVRPTHDRDL